MVNNRDTFGFFEMSDGIYRLEVPFEDVFTSVFLLLSERGNVIIDSATTKSDVTEHIIPALEKENIRPCDIRYILASHFHGDHSGGIPYLAEYLDSSEILAFDMRLVAKLGSRARIMKDREMIEDFLEILSLPGHTDDSAGFFDHRTNTVITCDAVQLCGVGRYGTGLWNVDDYLASLSALYNISPDSLIASHDYEPLGMTAYGRDAVRKYLDEARLYIERLCDNVRDRISCGMSDMSHIAEEYNSHSGLPPISAATFGAISLYLQTKDGI